MKIQPITNTNTNKTPPFKCYKGTTKKTNGYTKVIQDTGVLKGNKLDIYSTYTREGKLMHKLYYLTDNAGKWIKSKLKLYSDGKCYKVFRSEANGKKNLQ